MGLTRPYLKKVRSAQDAVLTRAHAKAWLSVYKSLLAQHIDRAASIGACAGANDAGPGLSQQPITGRISAGCRCFSSRASGNWICDGQNLRIEFRWAEGQYDKMPSLASELVDRPRALLFAAGPSAALAANPIAAAIGRDFTSQVATPPAMTLEILVRWRRRDWSAAGNPPEGWRSRNVG